MLRALLLIFAFLLPAALFAANPDTSYGPLWAYNGAWQIARKDRPAGTKPDQIVNQCAAFGGFFACQQAVNGQVSTLLIFVPANAAGKYYTQTVKPDGRATGRGDLVIDGDTWTFSTNWNQGGGRSTFYRTIHTFSGKNRIHFEQQESRDNQVWKTTDSGDETRTAPGRMTTVR